MSPAIQSVYADAIAALLWGPKTRSELQEITGASRVTISRLVSELRKAGVVYLCDCRETGGRADDVFAMQAKPFGEPDFHPMGARKGA